MRSIRRRCGFDGFSSDVVKKVVVLLWKMGGGEKKGEETGDFGGMWRWMQFSGPEKTINFGIFI